MSVDFKKIYDGPVSRLTTLDEVREFVSYYNSIKVLDRLLVVEDLAFLPPMSEGYLLKFVEETPLNLVLLSYYDSVSSIMLSRVKRVEKYYNEKTSSSFQAASVGYKRMAEELSVDSHYFDRVKFMSKVSPKMFFLESKVSTTRNKGKILGFLD